MSPWEEGLRHVLPIDVAAALRAHRRIRGMSAREVALAVGTTHSHISMIERGERAPSVTVARGICDALDLEPNLADRLLAAAVPHAGRDYPRDGRR